MTNNLPEPVKKLIERLAALPSLGPRQATRLAFYIIGRGGGEIESLADAVKNLAGVKICRDCFFVHQNENGLCDICKNPSRRKDAIMVVEKETDLVSLEAARKFNGRYLILGQIEKTGILDEAQKLRLQALKNFINKELNGQAEEIILAMNPTTIGNFQALLITKDLKPLAKKISRLGQGLPVGGEIEFADDETLGSALDGRI